TRAAIEVRYGRPARMVVGVQLADAVLVLVVDVRAILPAVGNRAGAASERRYRDAQGGNYARRCRGGDASPRTVHNGTSSDRLPQEDVDTCGGTCQMSPR